MKRKHDCPLWHAIVILTLAILACGLPNQTVPTTAPTATPAPLVTEASSTPALPAATSTPAPDVTAVGGCTLNAAWVADVTVPDNTQFAPGSAFTKTWRMRNSGTCNWEAGTQLVYIAGDPLGGPVGVSVSPVASGANTDISVNLTAPATPGTYKSSWQLQGPGGVRFGSQMWAQIVVPAPATATPTLTVTPTPTITTTPTITPTTSPCVAPDTALAPVLAAANGLGYDLGCPTQAAFSVSGALQEFWANVGDADPNNNYRSLMIWRSDNLDIYVIDGQDANASQGLLLAYTDIWLSDQPEIPAACAGMTPPSGYQLPKRGFGKVWCNNNLVGSVGWPSAEEVGVTLLVQPMQTGLLLKVSGPLPLFYLIALDYRAVWAITMMVSP